MDTPAEVLAQSAWQTYVVEVGRALPNGLADVMGVGQIESLNRAGYAVVQLPTVLHKGPNDTDAGFFRQAADRIDTGTNVHIGGSNVRRAVSQLLRRAADAAEALGEVT